MVRPQLAEALACMHQYGLIHRDIKAENIVFKDTATQAAAKGVPPIVKFIDLGMATLYNKDEHIQGTHIAFKLITFRMICSGLLHIDSQSDCSRI